MVVTGRTVAFVKFFYAADYSRVVEGKRVYIIEENVACCFNLLNSSRGGTSVFRLSRKNLLTCLKNAVTIFTMQKKTWLDGLGRRRSHLLEWWHDIINFLKQRMWLREPDSEYVEIAAIQTTLDVICGIKYRWAWLSAMIMRDDLVLIKTIWSTTCR